MPFPSLKLALNAEAPVGRLRMAMVNVRAMTARRRRSAMTRAATAMPYARLALADIEFCDTAVLSVMPARGVRGMGAVLIHLIPSQHTPPMMHHRP